MRIVNLLFAAICSGFAVYLLTLNASAAIVLGAAVLNFGTALIAEA